MGGSLGRGWIQGITIWTREEQKVVVTRAEQVEESRVEPPKEGLGCRPTAESREGGAMRNP